MKQVIHFKIPKMPLDICVADSQGGIGYMIEKVLRNILLKENQKKYSYCSYTGTC
jgi:carbamate kinase